MSDLLRAGLLYISLHWPVFPLCWPHDGRCACGWRHPYKGAGKAPRTSHGLKDATLVEAIVRSWWHRLPTANIGLVTGGASRIVVLDVDPRHGGDESLRDLEQRHGALPSTVTAISGSGGPHYYLAHPGGVVKSTTVAPGLDLKADGGYVVAPPSRHAGGGVYQWDAACAPQDAPLAPAPAWLLALARPPEGTRPNAAQIAQTIPEGKRNAALFRVAGALRRLGLTPAEITPALDVVNAARCRPPLDGDEIAEIAAGIQRYAPARPLARPPRRGVIRLG